MIAVISPRIVLLCIVICVCLPADLFAADNAPLKIVIAHGPGKGELAKYAKWLEENYNVKCSFVVSKKSKKAKGSEKQAMTVMKGIEALDDCDVILSNLYRTWAPPEQLSVLKKHFLSRPVVGLRKAHHGFQNWLEADRQVFGVTYRGHYGSSKDGEIKLLQQYKNHPFFEGMHVTLPGGGCYGHRDPEPDLEVYMVGGKKEQESHPQTWSRIVKQRGGQRIFYTRYDPQNLDKNPTVRHMVTQALFWAAKRDAMQK